MARWSTVVAFGALFSGHASAICSGPSSFCERLPNLDDKNSVIFVGTVLEKRGTMVGFRIREKFLNAAVAEMELLVTSDLYVDGVPQGGPSFVQGQDWLVEARRQNVNEPWTTSNCLRTKALYSAIEDLSVLRTWRNGLQLPARISGEVWDPGQRKNISSIQINLVGGTQPLSTTTDERGQFVFKDLVPGKYEIVALLPTGAITRELDLTHAWCVRTVFLSK
jgi:hypothetical protein